MPNQDLHDALTEDWDGQYCDITKRILIASPLPATLREFIAVWTSQCYDVMIFHHMEPEVLAKLPCDLIVIDIAVRQGDEEALESKITALHRVAEVPMIVLTSSPEQISSALPPHAIAVQWPDSEQQVIALAERMIAKLGSLSVPARSQADPDLIFLKDIVLDQKRMTVYRKDARIDVTKTEWDLLHVLARSGGKALTRQELMDQIWGDHYFGGSNTVDVHIKSLRHKLGDDPRNPRYIATIRGVGYRLAD